MIQPLLEDLAPGTVVEVGDARGEFSELLASWARENQATAHVVGPDALRQVRQPDVVLIEGDPNWNAVVHELKFLAGEAARGSRPFPTVLVHDVSRDRGPTPRHGTATAVADFVHDTGLELEHRQLPGWHGLGVVVHLTGHAVAAKERALARFEDLATGVAQVERERLSEQLAFARAELTESIAAAEAFRTALEAARARTGELSEESEAARGLVERTQLMLRQTEEAGAEALTRVRQAQARDRRRAELLKSVQHSVQRAAESRSFRYGHGFFRLLARLAGRHPGNQSALDEALATLSRVEAIRSFPTLPPQADARPSREEPRRPSFADRYRPVNSSEEAS